MLTATQGQAIMHHNFHEYAPFRGEVPTRVNGVMIANQNGSVNAYAAGSDLTPDLDPAELSQIEVLKGPQGTLYGASAVGGVVKFDA